VHLKAKSFLHVRIGKRPNICNWLYITWFLDFLFA